MPQAGAIRAGRAFVELFADDSKLVRGLKRAQAKLMAFGQGIRNLGLKIAGLGAAMLAPLLGAAKAFSSMGDQVAKMAKRTGLSVEALSEMRFVASQTGTEFESLEMGFRRMQRSIYDAWRGLLAVVDALTRLSTKLPHPGDRTRARRESGRASGPRRAIHTARKVSPVQRFLRPRSTRPLLILAPRSRPWSAPV